jgi:hypothetical protein
VRLLYADGTDVVDLSPAAAGGVEALDDLADVDTATALPGSGDLTCSLGSLVHGESPGWLWACPLLWSTGR